MKIKIKRIDKSLPLPEYKTKGAAAFDLYSRAEIFIKPKELCFIPTNLIIKIPKGYALFVFPRSSTPKKGLLIPHGAGIIDSDYCGENDEILFQTLNYTNKKIKIEKGERIGQAVFIKTPKVSLWQEIEEINKKSRGGFGSTGN